MKIAALVSVVAAGRQPRDTQSLFDQFLGDQNDNLGERNTFFESDKLNQLAAFYGGQTVTGKVRLSSP